MKINDIMTTDTYVARPDQSVQEIARVMLDLDIGAVPVVEGDRLIGMVTDRDIAVRIVAADKSASTMVREAMSPDIKYCFEDDDTDHVARNMGEQQVKRLPVLNREKRLVGIIALADLAATTGTRPVGEAVAGISQAGGVHSQRSTA